MTDRPILFSAPMIRALLDGRKTQTRRVLNRQPPEWATYCEQPVMYNVLGQWVPSGLWRWCDGAEDPPRPLRSWPVDGEGRHYWLRPPIASGDRLWVRKTWRTDASWDGVAPRFIPPASPLHYAANERPDGFGQMRVSIHMPRWASRLTLYVTDVRVQRLHDISEEDAIAEGAYVGKRSGRVADDYVTMAVAGIWFPSARAWYADLWNRINGPGAWDANPWVAAYTFKVRRGNIDALPLHIGEAAA